MSLPCNLNDEANTQTSSLVSTAECINNIQFLVAELLDSDFLNLCPNILAHRMVVVLILFRSPPNLILAVSIHYNVLVLRRTTCVDTCHYVDCVELSINTLVETFKTSLCLLFEEELIRWIVSYHL